jgi:hypothetical protein
LRLSRRYRKELQGRLGLRPGRDGTAVVSVHTSLSSDAWRLSRPGNRARRP